jgi:hypothetical protein
LNEAAMPISGTPAGIFQAARIASPLVAGSKRSTSKLP